MAEITTAIDEFEGFSFKKALSDYVASRPDKVITAISPSRLGSCLRSHYYAIKQIQPTTPPTEIALVNFEMGFIWEELMVKALKNQNREFDWQVPIDDPELNMAGTIDFIIYHPAGEIVADLKTMRSAWFWYLAKTNQEFVAQNSQYAYQLGAYMLMRKRQGFNVVAGQFPFISKDDGMIYREINLLLTPELEQRVLDRVRLLNAYLATDTIPPCECEGWQISYCPMGRLSTKQKNSKGKLVVTECCGLLEEMEKWRNE